MPNFNTLQCYTGGNPVRHGKPTYSGHYNGHMRLLSVKVRISIHSSLSCFISPRGEPIKVKSGFTFSFPSKSMAIDCKVFDQRTNRSDKAISSLTSLVMAKWLGRRRFKWGRFQMRLPCYRCVKILQCWSAWQWFKFDHSVFFLNSSRNGHQLPLKRIWKCILHTIVSSSYLFSDDSCFPSHLLFLDPCEDPVMRGYVRYNLSLLLQFSDDLRFV